MRPGYIIIPYLLQGIRLLESGVATKEDIDQVFHSINFPPGPLALCDLVGLDTLLFIADSMYGQTKDEAFAAPFLLRNMVSAGRLGMKTGSGFYNYS